MDFPAFHYVMVLPLEDAPSGLEFRWAGWRHYYTDQFARGISLNPLGRTKARPVGARNK